MPPIYPARRFCGRLVITITITRGKTSTYRCRIAPRGLMAVEGEPITTQHVGASQDALRKRDESTPEALDGAAHAALSFADDEGHDVASLADFTDAGWAVVREAP